MYGHSRLRERNQVTIPPFVVEKMNLKPDDIVEFVLNDKGTIELHPAKIVKMGSPGARLEEVLAVQEIKRGDYAEIRDADDLRQYVEKVRTGGGSSAETNAAPADTKPAFAVMLRTVGANKINVVNAVREITKLGLKEAKELVDAAPKIVKEVVSKDEAEKIEKKFVQAGATVEIQNATAPEEVGSLVEFEITLPAEITGSQTVTVQCKGRVVRAGTSNNEESGVYHITDPHIGNRYDEIAKDCE